MAYDYLISLLISIRLVVVSILLLISHFSYLHHLTFICSHYIQGFYILLIFLENPTFGFVDYFVVVVVYLCSYLCYLLCWIWGLFVWGFFSFLRCKFDFFFFLDYKAINLSFECVVIVSPWKAMEFLWFCRERALTFLLLCFRMS